MKEKGILSKVFIGIIFVGFISIIINTGLSELNIVTRNKDNWKAYEGVEENNIFDKVKNKLSSLENSIENRINNNFFMYDNINALYQNLNFYSNKLVYTEVPIKTNSDNEYVFFDKNNNFYYLENKYTKEELNERLTKEVEFFNELSKDLDIYIYIPTRYELTPLSKRSLSNYVTDFTSKLSGAIKYKTMNIESIEKYKEYFYKTDHHWTIAGALNGYYDIMAMLDKNPLNNLNIESKSAKKYYGSLAKTALNDNVYDYITDVTIDLDYDAYVNGKKPDENFKPRKLRTDRSYKYYDYYVSYFNGQYGNIVYDFKQESEENLLILCDSYAWQIDYLIAASFNKTHVINLRYDDYKNKSFDIKSYMKANDIDKVLFLYEGGSIIFDQYNYDFVGRLK